MNSDYKTTATGQGFAPVGRIESDVSTSDTVITYYNIVIDSDLAIQVGMSMLVDDEVMGIQVITDETFTVKRGCFDTIPAAHAEDAVIWIIDGYVGTDLVPYMGSEQIGVKLLPRTSTGTLPIENSPPLGLTMNQRMIRPYNVGQFHMNGVPWNVSARLSSSTPNATLTWVERNRVVQADQIVGQLDAGVAAEAGTTYHFHVFKTDGTLAASYDNIASGFSYNRAQASTDFDLISVSDTGDYAFYALMFTARDGYSCWQAYRLDLLVDTTSLAVGLITEDGDEIDTEDDFTLVLEN